MIEHFTIFSLGLVLIVYISHTIQAITGFGSVVIGLALAAHLFPLTALVPLFVILNIPLCVYFLVIDRASINPGILFRKLMPWLIPGFVVGILLSSYLTGSLARIVFGIVLIVLSVREILRILKPSSRPIPPLVIPAALFAGGFVQGVYASGGPFVTYAIAAMRLDRSGMRANLMAIWLILNGILAARFAWMGTIDAAMLKDIGLLLPVLMLGMITGQMLHHRIPERGFLLLVYIVLFVSGITLLR
ncbi:MAG: sulfite exporter TauE/SafE family protein [Leptospirales bacterium]|nr:sulfite exporter TauE/SafE family protein [Leptospirales bacterium]